MATTSSERWGLDPGATIERREDVGAFFAAEAAGHEPNVVHEAAAVGAIHRHAATIAAPANRDRTSAFPPAPTVAPLALDETGNALAVVDGDRQRVQGAPTRGG